MTEAMDATVAKLTLRALRRILRVTEIGRRQLAADTGLSPSQLLVLREIGGSGQTTPGVVAATLQFSQASITAITDRLESEGLVARARGQKDKRQVILTPTAAGRAVLSRTPDPLQLQFETRFEALAPWEQAMILAAVERLGAILGAADYDAAPLLDSGAIDPPRG